MKVVIYEWEHEVISVTEVKQKVNHRKVSKDGEQPKYEFDEVSIGWSVRTSESSAIGYFKNKPDLKVGDTVTMTMQKKV